ncbi:hypothetical protein SRB5_11370 [Streptomyces sp. RB5]|uniref:DNA-binding protein n=1 Tax=Streptomyces smaragdinus TaxID=2585196 RepID=A0A7K0CC93_9ACTN|nr:hypothetical protein [Streptomyces smaragdinus]MQY11023.1 hypothetical protein [Streptomyces smaragdinus]
MPEDADDEARRHLAALAGGPADPDTPAQRLAQDAALVGRMLAAADTHRAPEDEAAVAAALALLAGLRLSLDRLEAGVVLEARRCGMDWRQIAARQGLNSSQAASQRYQRLVTRLEEIRQGVR